MAYVFIKMANSPRPGVWILERSKDFGKTWRPWQYFADTPSDCMNYFNTPADEKLVTDNQILCTTEFSKIVPLSNGEVSNSCSLKANNTTANIAFTPHFSLFFLFFPSSSFRILLYCLFMLPYGFHFDLRHCLIISLWFISL